MRLHYLQHVPFEGLGSIEYWAKERSATVSHTQLFSGEPLPPAGEAELLVVMGGPMGVSDEKEHPWLKQEKKFLTQAISCGTKVLGICLGAQLIAEALGARVYPNEDKEIGWFPIQGIEDSSTTGVGSVLSNAGDVFHWHGDTFDLPLGAMHLARSRACENQAFSIDNQILALQFHLETTPSSAQALIEHCGHEITDGRYIQSVSRMLKDHRQFERINALMTECLDIFI